MSKDQIIDALRSFINHELLEGAADDLDATTPLLELGVLDSLSMVSLLAFIDEKYGVTVPEEYVLPEHFETVAHIASLIDSLSAEDSSERERCTDELAQLVALQESYGIKSRRYSLSGGRVQHALETEGATPTWLLLPALGNPSTAWSSLLRTIDGQQRAIALDLAGFGLSSTNVQAPTYKDQLEMVLETVKQIPGDLVLIGNSAGVPIATELARQNPERVRALVVTGFGLIEDVAGWWAGLEELSTSPEAFMQQAYHRPPKLTAALSRLLEDVLSRPAYHSFLEGGAADEMRSAFEGLHLPTLFIQGESDQIIPRAAVEAAAARIPNARIEWLARCGHFSAAERPEPFLWFIQQFLDQLDLQ